MSLTLRKSKFKRNRSREKNIGDIFHRVSSSLSLGLSLTLTLFFTPVLMATSLFSQEIVLILINLCLCLGNLTNFLYGVYQGNIGKFELAVSLLVLTGFVVGAYCLFPAILAPTTVLGAFALVNQIAVGINLFFLLKNNIVPPIIGWGRSIGKYLGLDINEESYQVEPLDLKKDAYIVNALMQKHFGHSFKEGPVEEDLKKLNLLLEILKGYINKYDEAVLGDIKHSEAISAIKGHIKQITLKGSADSSYSFIKQKIAFKEVKLERLVRVKKKLQKNEVSGWERFSQFYKGVTKSSYHSKPAVFHNEGMKLLDQEMNKQQNKIDRLSCCLP